MRQLACDAVRERAEIDGEGGQRIVAKDSLVALLRDGDERRGYMTAGVLVCLLLEVAVKRLISARESLPVMTLAERLVVARSRCGACQRSLACRLGVTARPSAKLAARSGRLEQRRDECLGGSAKVITSFSRSASALW